MPGTSLLPKPGSISMTTRPAGRVTKPVPDCTEPGAPQAARAGRARFRPPDGGQLPAAFGAESTAPAPAGCKITVPMCSDGPACLNTPGMLTFSSAMLTRGQLSRISDVNV